MGVIVGMGKLVLVLVLVMVMEEFEALFLAHHLSILVSACSLFSIPNFALVRGT